VPKYNIPAFHFIIRIIWKKIWELLIFHLINYVVY
jgi:hypothetical protein